MEDKDIRWKQRFSNYSKALSQLELFVNKGEELNEMEEQGLIKSFEYTFEPYYFLPVICRNSASDMIFTVFIFLAFSSLLPASSPTTK